MVARDRRSRTALIADDDVMVTRIITMALEADGWTVLAASDGIEAMDAIARTSLDLCITDRFMPGPPLEVRLAELSRLRPAAAVVVLSGMDDDNELPEDVIVLKKPVSLGGLRDGIARAEARKPPLVAFESG